MLDDPTCGFTINCEVIGVGMMVCSALMFAVAVGLWIQARLSSRRDRRR